MPTSLEIAGVEPEQVQFNSLMLQLPGTEMFKLPRSTVPTCKDQVTHKGKLILYPNVPIRLFDIGRDHMK